MENGLIIKLVKVQQGKGLLKEIRCVEDPQHRLQAAKLLFNLTQLEESIPYLCNMVIYDPDPQVRTQIKTMLHERFGRELDNILQVEGSDGNPIEEPWMLPCQVPTTSDVLDKEFSQLVANKDFATLQMFLRDPNDPARRLNAARALAADNSVMTQELLAMSVLFDPDKRVGQQAYQSLYEIVGDEKAETVMEQVGSASLEEEINWLSNSDESTENPDPYAEDDSETSLFGISQSDQISGLINLLSGENNPQKRKAVLKALDDAGDIFANNAIARTALFDLDGQVREYAKSLLKEHLGDQLDGYLDRIHELSSPGYSDSTADETDENEGEPSDSYVDEFSTQLRSQPSVISEGNNLLPLWLIGGIAIVAMLLYFILR